MEGDSMKKKVVLGSCPICGKSSRAIDSTRDVPNNLRKCDGNEFFTCYTDKDNKTLRYVKRNKQERQIDWSKTEGGRL